MRDAGDFEILVQFFLLRRGRDGDSEPCVARPLQQIRYRGKRPDQREVPALEPLAAPLLQFFTVVFPLCGVQEGGNELVSALAYLASGLFEADVMTELHHRFVPGDRMKVHRVQESAVQVEDGSFWQVEVSRVCAAP